MRMQGVAMRRSTASSRSDKVPGAAVPSAPTQSIWWLSHGTRMCATKSQSERPLPRMSYRISRCAPAIRCR